MDFEVYCDENHPELFTSKKPQARFLMIGSLWLPASLRDLIKKDVWKLREKHQAWGEVKWQKVSKNKLSFYKDLIDLFLQHQKELRFRCIAVDHKAFNKSWHQNDNELGFYKFYYQVLHHWILDFNTYSIFCDIKTNRDLTRLSSLRDSLKASNLTSDIKNLQALPSSQLILIQLTDLLLGIASSRLNKSLKSGGAKEELVVYLESKLGTAIAPTFRAEEKFNVFQISLKGGW